MLPNSHEMTDWVFQWGQFVDHDIDLTGAASPAESFNVSIPTGDPMFDPASTGTQIMPLSAVSLRSGHRNRTWQSAATGQ